MPKNTGLEIHKFFDEIIEHRRFKAVTERDETVFYNENQEKKYSSISQVFKDKNSKRYWMATITMSHPEEWDPSTPECESFVFVEVKRDKLIQGMGDGEEPIYKNFHKSFPGQ